MSHRVGRDRRILVRDLVIFEAQRQHDRRELAERFAHQQRTRAGAIDEITDLLPRGPRWGLRTYLRPAHPAVPIGTAARPRSTPLPASVWKNAS